MDSSGTTLVGLTLIVFFALLLIGGLLLVGAMGVYAYKNFQARAKDSESSLSQRWLPPVLLGGLLTFLGALGLAGTLTFIFFFTVTGAAGVLGSGEAPIAELSAPTYVIREPVPTRMKLVAEVRGSLDPELVQKLSDIATRRRELDLRVRSRQTSSGETFIYEFELPPLELDPSLLQQEMRKELEARGLVPVSLTSQAIER